MFHVATNRGENLNQFYQLYPSLAGFNPADQSVFPREQTSQVALREAFLATQLGNALGDKPTPHGMDGFGEQLLSSWGKFSCSQNGGMIFGFMLPGQSLPLFSSPPVMKPHAFGLRVLLPAIFRSGVYPSGRRTTCILPEKFPRSRVEIATIFHQN